MYREPPNRISIIHFHTTGSDLSHIPPSTTNAIMTRSTSKRKGVVLWLGGTSSLARTYINEFGSDNLILSGSKPDPPAWVDGCRRSYVALNLLTVTESEAMSLMKDFPEISMIIVGVRPRLFAPFVDPSLHHKMTQGLSLVIEVACKELDNLSFVLHLSSVAAVNHLQSQHYRSETQPLTDLSLYRFPYDIFKRRCEEEISEICQRNNVRNCHLRLSALFSDDPKCIQCCALDLQCRIGCYLRVAIDCNSSVNVSRAIDLLLVRSEALGNCADTSIKTMYYYTRPLALRDPVPYGYYLQEFRRAHRLRYTVSIPQGVVTCFVSLFHWVASWNCYFGLPYLDSADYLLQVASREHSFDCTLFAEDFPEIHEESIHECFVRRNVVLKSYSSRSPTPLLKRT